MPLLKPTRTDQNSLSALIILDLHANSSQRRVLQYTALSEQHVV